MAIVNMMPISSNGIASGYWPFMLKQLGSSFQFSINGNRFGITSDSNNYFALQVTKTLGLKKTSSATTYDYQLQPGQVYSARCTSQRISIYNNEEGTGTPVFQSSASSTYFYYDEI